MYKLFLLPSTELRINETSISTQKQISAKENSCEQKFLKTFGFASFFCKPDLLKSLSSVHRLKQNSLVVNGTH